MPRHPDLPCAGCGRLMWRGTTSLPEGQARCRECRRTSPVHGTEGAYKVGCRCQACLAGKNLRQRQFVQQYKDLHGHTYRSRFDPGANRHTNNSVWTEARRKASATRRARKAGARVEAFKPLEVFERDSWICGICTEPVDRTLAYPDPMSVSLDHVVPLVHGGEHSRANTRCSHLTCNVKRGARLDAA